MRPFTAKSFATGIEPRHADIGTKAIAILQDGSIIASGGKNRGSLYRFDKTGGIAGIPVTLNYPIFDMAVDENNIWATTGGGPLLQLDSQTVRIIKQYATGITTALAIHPTTGEIYVSSGNGIEIFDPKTETFKHFSSL